MGVQEKIGAVEAASPLAHLWTTSAKARVALSRIKAADFRTGSVPGIQGAVYDRTELRPCTDAGWAVHGRLEAIRNEAVSAELGHTLDAAMEPFNEARASRWLDLRASIPTASDAVAAELARRESRSAAA